MGSTGFEWFYSIYRAVYLCERPPMVTALGRLLSDFTPPMRQVSASTVQHYTIAESLLVAKEDLGRF